MLFTVKEIPPEYKAVLERIDGLRARLKYATSDDRRRWTGLLRRNTFAKAVRGSNSIEGYNVTQDDAVAAVEGEQPFSAEAETWMAVIGYRNALSYILQLADDPYFSYNEAFIRSLHYMMISYDVSKRPGRWRPGAIWVRNEPTGETVYEGPDADSVPALMKELVDSLNQPPNETPAIVRAAMAHLNLVMIHPFSDGNGRMGRALQTAVLAREGILDPTFSSIEEYLGRNTLDYYAVLAEVGHGSWNPQRDPLPWIRFCLTAHYRQADTLLRRTKELGRLWDKLEVEIKRRGFHERTVFALADAAMGFRVRNSTYRKNAEVSDQVAGKELRDLAEAGLLVPEGERRGRYYVAGQWLKDVHNATREPRITVDPFEEVEAANAARQGTLFETPIQS